MQIASQFLVKSERTQYQSYDSRDRKLDLLVDVGSLVKGAEKHYSLFLLMMVGNRLLSESLAWHVNLGFPEHCHPHSCFLPPPSTPPPNWMACVEYPTICLGKLFSLSLRSSHCFLAQNLTLFFSNSCFSLNRGFISTSAQKAWTHFINYLKLQLLFLND